MVEVINSALSLRAKFTPCFLPAKAEAKNGKRSGFHQAEGMIPALHGDVMFTKGRVRAGDLLGPGPAAPGFISSAHSPPLPRGIAGYHSTRDCSCPCSGDKHHSGSEARNAQRMWGCKQGCKAPSPLLSLPHGGCPGAHPSTELWNPSVPSTVQGIMSWASPCK